MTRVEDAGCRKISGECRIRREVGCDGQGQDQPTAVLTQQIGDMAQVMVIDGLAQLPLADVELVMSDSTTVDGRWQINNVSCR